MARESLASNPFMLMMHPELVLAAVEKSERLSQLNRHLCRPLDKPTPAKPGVAVDAAFTADDDDDGEPNE